jgi:hypothetical protein
MEDKRSIKKVLENQGDVHEKVANQSNSELLSLSPTRGPGPPRIQIDVQIAYDLRFGRSTYALKPIQRRRRKFSDKCKNCWTMGTYVRALVLVLFLLFWFLRKMVLGACVLIVEP